VRSVVQVKERPWWRRKERDPLITLGFVWIDPKTTKVHSQEDVNEYLEKYGVKLSHRIKVEFCPLDTKFGLSPPDGRVCMHPQVLVLELKLSLMKFVHSVLTFYQIAPSQLSGVVWRIVLGFETLCILKVPEACHRKFLVLPTR